MKTTKSLSTSIIQFSRSYLRNETCGFHALNRKIITNQFHARQFHSSIASHNSDDNKANYHDSKFKFNNVKRANVLYVLGSASTECPNLQTLLYDVKEVADYKLVRLTHC